MKFSSQAVVSVSFLITTTIISISASPMKVEVQKDPIKIENDLDELNPDDIQYVVGGDSSDDGQYPYYVLMREGKSSNAFGFCGGSLIAPRVVLTAAHCQPENNIGNILTVGPTDRYSLDNGSSQRARNIKSQAAVPHPDYNPNSESNDFALVLLKEEYVIDSNGVQLVLNDESSFPPDDDELDVLGMGDLSFKGNFADVLMDVKVKSFSNSQCNSYFGGNPIKNNMICAGFEKGGKDSCQGDSGGPLVKVDGNTHTQVGVVSWGYGCADANSPGVYSRVSAQIDWMRDQICDEWGVESSLCGQTTPTPPSPTPPSPTPPSPTPLSPTPPSPTTTPMSPTPPTSFSFEKLGKGYPRDSKGKFNKKNWYTKDHCVGLTACQDKCKAQHQCVGIAWASEPTSGADDTGCGAVFLPRCVVYYGITAKTVTVEKVSRKPKEYSAYRYGAPVDPTVCADSESFKWYGFAEENCNWVAEQKNKGNNICKEYAKSTGKKKVKHFCKKTCGKC